MQELFAALRGNQDATDGFFSAITGAKPLGDFMSPENLSGVIDRRSGRHVNHAGGTCTSFAKC